jgi:glutathione synthase/RimK-type ligase-like ATP-grasp enzyme
VTLARNKKASRQAMGALAPKTWFKAENVQLPAVVRPRRHHAANKFFVATTQAELKKAILKCGVGWYASELIKKDSEYRVFVLHGRIVAVSQRFPAHTADVAWNLATGGKLINLKHASWPVPVLKAAIAATKAVGLDWSAMDIATEKGTGRVVVFEANTAPGLKNPYTLGCIAKAFNYVASHGTPKPVTASASKWKDYIHPAVKAGVGA